MATEWIDIVDTSIKIGLGALISGSFTYIGNRFSHNAQKKKFMLEHRIKVIEEVSQQLDVYFIAWERLMNRVMGVTKRLELEKKEQTYENIESAIKEKDKELTQSWTELKSAASRLRLINADTVISKLSECTKLEGDLRNKLVFDKEYISFNEISDYNKKALKAKRDTLQALAEEYKSTNH